MKGHIKITDKVYFKPEGLPKPKHLTCGDRKNDIIHYQSEMKAYEASKKKVEVSNRIYFVGKGGRFIDIYGMSVFTGRKIKNNQPCEAEVNGKATIIKIL